jgi:hypothetical protein
MKGGQVQRRRGLLCGLMTFLVLTGLAAIVLMCQCGRATPPPSSARGTYAPSHGQAQNGDAYNVDNDGDGRREPVYVKGYHRKDGTYVRSHYRVRSRR